MVTPLYGGGWPPQLFADGVRYVLPHYQRNYSWDVDRVSQFLQKLLVAVKTGYEELLAAVPAGGAIPKETLRDWPATQDAENFGFMVLFQDPTEDGLYGVVDGQQRMITLSFILAALRECFLASDAPGDAECAGEMHGVIEQRAQVSRGLDAVPRVTVRGADAPLFRALSLTPGAMQAAVAAVEDGRTAAVASKSQARMVAAQGAVLRALQGEPRGVLRLLASYLHECQCETIVCTEQRTAHKLFGTLNFVGSLQLEPLDRFRSAVIIADEQRLIEQHAARRKASALEVGSRGALAAVASIQSALEPTWDALEGRHGRKTLSDAILNYIQSRRGLHLVKNVRIDDVHPDLPLLYEEEAGWLLDMAGGGAETFLDDSFTTLLAHYRTITSAGDGTPPPAAGTRQGRTAALLASLRDCYQLPWAPVAAAYLRPRLDHEGVALPGLVPAVDAFLAALDRYVFFLLLTQSKAVGWERLDVVLRDVHAGADPLLTMRLGGGDLRQLREALADPRLGAKQKGVPGSVLRRAEAALRASRAHHGVAAAAPGGAPVNAAAARPGGGHGWTVEHVLPVTVKDGSAWARAVADPAAVRQCLGNLTLLDVGTNSRASNRSFGHKKAEYERREGDRMAALTAEVVSEATWDERVIHRRRDRLIDLLLEPYLDASS